jgi:hypothetical protein
MITQRLDTELDGRHRDVQKTLQCSLAVLKTYFVVCTESLVLFTEYLKMSRKNT